jgi:Rad3-related DNA helicase
MMVRLFAHSTKLVAYSVSTEGRISLAIEGEGERKQVIFKYQLLNPAVHFKDVLSAARSVILAGGTMSPVGVSLAHPQNLK